MSAGATLLLLSLVEVGIELLLRNPRLLPSTLVPLFRSLYRSEEWRNVQLDPECANYDGELTYTFRPGEFRFTNREFDNHFAINRKGLRDDEESLRRPETIVLGDSHAAGWGVEANESWVGLLEEATGSRVLCVAVPSYGTVRETGFLERLNTSALETLVVQYCENDYAENAAWIEKGGELEIMPYGRWQTISRVHLRSLEYYFGKHLVGMGRLFFGGRRNAAIIAPTRRSPAGAEEEAAVFLKVLASAPVDLRKVRLLVLELNANAANDASFVEAVRAIVDRGEAPAGLEHIETLDLSTVLREEHYYVLDSHMRPSGHRIVADHLGAALEREPRGGHASQSGASVR